MKTWNGLSQEKIIELVDQHEDGFNYAQLQTGIDRFELIQILEEAGFDTCDYCGEWVDKGTLRYYIIRNYCEVCREEFQDEGTIEISFS